MYHWRGAFSSNLPVEWDNIKSHFSMESHFLNDIELVFVNQVLGKSIRNVPICDTTTSAVDDAIQCSLFGPDVFSPSIDTSWTTGSNNAFDFSSVKFENYHKEAKLPITYVKNKSAKKMWNKLRALRSSTSIEVVKKWMGSPGWIPNPTLMGSFFVVTNHDHSRLSRDQCTYKDECLSNKFILPNLPCYYDGCTLTQSFHTMTKIQ